MGKKEIRQITYQRGRGYIYTSKQGFALVIRNKKRLEEYGEQNGIQFVDENNVPITSSKEKTKSKEQ